MRTPTTPQGQSRQSPRGPRLQYQQLLVPWSRPSKNQGRSSPLRNQPQACDHTSGKRPSGPAFEEWPRVSGRNCKIGRWTWPEAPNFDSETVIVSAIDQHNKLATTDLGRKRGEERGRVHIFVYVFVSETALGRPRARSVNSMPS